jgi:hypothetical protein
MAHRTAAHCLGRPVVGRRQFGDLPVLSGLRLDRLLGSGRVPGSIAVAVGSFADPAARTSRPYRLCSSALRAIGLPTGIVAGRTAVAAAGKRQVAESLRSHDGLYR